MRDRSGDLKAWALVDPDVYEWASLTPWYLVGQIGRQFVVRWKDGRRFYLHKLVLGLTDGRGTHVNGDRLDNRRANLLSR